MKGTEKRARQAERMKDYDAARERHRSATHLRALGVAVCGSEVYREEPFSLRNRLGPLAGAQAEVIGQQAGHRRSGGARAADATLTTAALAPILGPAALAGLLAGASRKGFQGMAFVVFADRTYHEKPIPDAQTMVRAQADAVRFNALAGPPTPPSAETVDDPAIKLRKLQELYDAGLLTQEEYETKRAKVIDSI